MTITRIANARLPAAPDTYEYRHMSMLVDTLERQLETIRTQLNAVITETVSSTSPGIPGSTFAEGLWGYDPRPGINPEGMHFTTSATPTASTWVKVWHIDRRNYDMWNILSTRAIGTKLYVQTKMDSVNYVNYTLTGVPTLASNVITIPVSYTAPSGGSVASASWQECFLHFSNT
jgi:hypothetical protein